MGIVQLGTRGDRGPFVGLEPHSGDSLPVSLGKDKHVLKESSGLWGWFCPGHGVVWQSYLD